MNVRIFTTFSTERAFFAGWRKRITVGNSELAKVGIEATLHVLKVYLRELPEPVMVCPQTVHSSLRMLTNCVLVFPHH